MRAVMEPVAWVMRLYDGDGGPPDKSIGSLHMTLDLLNVSSIRAMVMTDGNHYTRAVRDAVFEEMARAGIVEAMWIRMDRDADGTATARLVRRKVPPLTEQRRKPDMTVTNLAGAAEVKKYKVTMTYKLEHQDAKPGDPPMFEIPGGLVWNQLDMPQADFLSTEFSDMLKRLPEDARKARQEDPTSGV